MKACSYLGATEAQYDRRVSGQSSHDVRDKEEDMTRVEAMTLAHNASSLERHCYSEQMSIIPI